MTSRPKADSRARTRRGFSLIEVMVASLVLVFMLLSSITALQMGFRMVDNARMASLANQAIQSQLESLKLLHWGYIGDVPDASPWYFQTKEFTNNLTTETTAAIAGGATGIDFMDRVQTVLGNADPSQTARFSKFELAVQNWSIANIKQIKVTVSWRGLNGKDDYTREFVTLYGKDGFNDFIVSGLPGS